MILFVAGNSRSGTTMMSRILSNHRDVFAFHELHFFDEIISGRTAVQPVNKEVARKFFTSLCLNQRGAYFGKPENPDKCFLEAERESAALEQPSTLSVFEKFLYNESARHGKTIPCEQTPQNVFVMEQLLETMPAARWILMVRDPRDVLLSQKYKWKRRALSGGKIPFMEALRSRVNYHPLLIPRIWNRVMAQVEKFKSHPSVLVVKFEDLLRDPEKITRECCRHVGISFEQGMIDIPVVGSSRSADSQDMRGIDSQKAGQWKHGGLNATEIKLCENITSKHLAAWGYDPAETKSNDLKLLWYYLVLPVQLVGAGILNWRRLMGWLRRLVQ